jgi:hypothetical protein
MLVVALVVAGLLAGCGDSPSAKCLTEPSGQHVDAACAQTILQALAHVEGVASRDIFASHSVSKPSSARLRAVYGDDWYDFRTRELTTIDWDSAFTGPRPLAKQPRDSEYRVLDLVEQRAGCIVAKTTFHDGMDPGWQDQQTSFVTLLTLNAQHDPARYNQTKWVLANMLAPAADDRPPQVDLCATAPIQSTP